MSVFVTGTLEPYAAGNFRVIDDTFTFLAGLGTNLAVANDVCPDYPIASYQGTLHRCDLSVKTAPTGASIIVDILFSTDSGSTFTSLWASHSGNRPTISASSKTGSQTSFDTGTYTQGTLWRLDIIQVGSTIPGQGLFVKLV